MTGFIDPSKETFAKFREDDRPGPIHMLNLVRFNASATYEDGRIATGAEAYAAYGRESYPVFSRLGGRIVWRGNFELMLIGPNQERWDECFIAEYPSVEAFVEMIKDPCLSPGGKAPAGSRRRFQTDPHDAVSIRVRLWWRFGDKLSHCTEKAAKAGYELDCHFRKTIAGKHLAWR